MKKDNNVEKCGRVIALAGNPNVGKSTVFNTLTGMHQHTGNWPGKTVSNASGVYVREDMEYTIYDLPGTYSLIAHSAEEECARDFICFGNPDATIVVCDAVCLERNLNLVLQTIEITPHVVVCVNLMDEARKKKIDIDLKMLSTKLGVPVVGASARSNQGIDETMMEVENVISGKTKTNPISIRYRSVVEDAISIVEKEILKEDLGKLSARWVALKLIDDDDVLKKAICDYIGRNLLSFENVMNAIDKARMLLLEQDVILSELKDDIVSELVNLSEKICQDVVHFEKQDYASKDRKIDRILTNKWTGIPIMLLLFIGVFWITIVGANYPSGLLFDFLFWIEDGITWLFQALHAPAWLYGALVLGVYRVLAWVVAVMLPPMAIFFPLFTLLEDLGYLPRIAFNLDKYFKKCCACGKQALTMCMGFGCNAAGVTGCRIIDSPRERMIAILTNNFVPCNGRFPTIISIITMFFVGFGTSFGNSILSTLMLTGVILFGIFMTLFVSKMLSKTLLKGVPSSFTLELPPYRKPQIGKVIVRSIFDRTLFVLGRAISVAAPAGLIIWLLANIYIGDTSLLLLCANFLDPFGKLIGLDGVILMAFILGFPANEIVVPIMIMGYMAVGSIADFDNLVQLKTLLVDNGWTWITGLCFMLFSLLHWPCSTTCLTIHKETGSKKWTVLSFLIPTVIGIVVCFIVNSLLTLLF